MAAYTVAVSEIAAHAKSLAANVEDTVTFNNYITGVELIVHSGTAAVYVRSNGTAAVAGANTRVVLPSNTLRMPTGTAAGATVIHLISTAAAVYSVEEA